MTEETAPKVLSAFQLGCILAFPVAYLRGNAGLKKFLNNVGRGIPSHPGTSFL